MFFTLTVASAVLQRAICGTWISTVSWKAFEECTALHQPEICKALGPCTATSTALMASTQRPRLTAFFQRSSAILPLPPLKREGQNGRASLKKNKFASFLKFRVPLRFPSLCASWVASAFSRLPSEMMSVTLSFCVNSSDFFVQSLRTAWLQMSPSVCFICIPLNSAIWMVLAQSISAQARLVPSISLRTVMIDFVWETLVHPQFIVSQFTWSKGHRPRTKPTKVTKVWLKLGKPRHSVRRGLLMAHT